MGYCMWFSGAFELDRPLTPEQQNYLTAFSEVRHVRWNTGLLDQMEDDPIRKAVGLPIGEYGRYFTGAVAIHGRCEQHPALAHIVVPLADGQTLTLNGINFPPPGVPDLWCSWAPTPDGAAIEHNGGDKFPCYAMWLHFLLDEFLIPWGYTLNGQVDWKGEDSTTGSITVINNEVSTKITSRGFGDVS